MFCGFNNQYCNLCAELHTSYCIKKCINTIFSGNQRLGAFKNHCYCKPGYASSDIGEECKPIQCNVRCSSNGCYQENNDTQCYLDCNPKKQNVDIIANLDFYSTTSCPCFKFTDPLPSYEYICYYHFNCARTCNSKCLRTVGQCDGSTYKADQQCLLECNPLSYGLVNEPITTDPSIPLWNCSCKSGLTNSNIYPEYCVYNSVNF